VFRVGVACHALPQQVQLALAPGDVALTTFELLEPPVHRVPKTFDLSAQIRALKIEAQLL
jgi:hypothetical protein